jgi:hypothetical protein
LAVTDDPALLWSELKRRVDAIDHKREEMDDAVFGRRKQTGKYKNDDVYVYPPESVNVKIDYAVLRFCHIRPSIVAETAAGA